MWWYKLVAHWSKRDLAEFSLFTWASSMGLLTVMRLVQGRPLELPFMAVISAAVIPLSFLIVFVFQKYSSRIGLMQVYPALAPTDFDGDELLRGGRSLVFFYTEWCPFSRGASHLLASLKPSSYEIYRADLSDEDNPLWASLKINRVPTLIAFKEGREFWRREAVYMVGLRKADFDEANSTISTS